MRHKHTSLDIRFTTGIAFTLLTASVVLNSGCSSARKKTTPELSDYRGKKIALVEIAGEATSKKIVEVALINQLVKRGDFILLPRQEIDEAKAKVESNTADWKDVAAKAGADYGLKIKVLDFEAKVAEGYSSEVVEDSQMAAERGEEGRKVDRLFKVKSLKGLVRYELQFAPVTGPEAGKDLRIGIAEAEKTVTENAKNGGIHLPPRLRFLESLSNEAFAGFFEKYD